MPKTIKPVVIGVLTLAVWEFAAKPLLNDFLIEGINNEKS